jgi:hypothetical protein
MVLPDHGHRMAVVLQQDHFLGWLELHRSTTCGPRAVLPKRVTEGCLRETYKL